MAVFSSWCNRKRASRIKDGMARSNEQREAFLTATMPHVHTVHAIARRHAHDPQAAEDVVQETYLRAFAAFDSYRGESIRSWLAAICLNVVREQARRRSARPVEILGHHLPATAELDDPAFAAVAARCEQREIARALEQLSPEQRVAIILVDIAALTHREAADALGCPRGTVLARVHRGRRRLAQLLVTAKAARDV